jgi:hypothetical protein
VLNPLGLAFLKLLLMSLVGVPLAAIVDPGGSFFYLVGGRSQEYIGPAYAWSWYTFVVLLGLTIGFGLNRRMTAYQLRPVVGFGRSDYLRIWSLALAGTLACAAVLFVQSGFTHPGLGAWGLSEMDVAQRRIEVWENVNQNVYNLGVHLFGALALVVSGFFLRSKGLFALSVVVFLLLATFSLAKSPVADTVVELAFVYLVLRRPSWRAIPLVAGGILLALIGMAWLTRWATGSNLAVALGVRIVWGQIADLPHYFNLFAHDRVGFAALLPPYIQNLFGAVEPSPSRLVMEFSNPEAVRLGIAGVANTLFIGEAYAFAGIPGVVLSPVLVAAHYAFVIWLFGKLRKDVFTVFLFGYLLDRMTSALFAGISSFVFSAMHIVLGAFLWIVLVYLASPGRAPARAAQA